MRRIITEYLQFFQHTAVCMRQLCLKSSNYKHIDTELTIITLYKWPNCHITAQYPLQVSLTERHLIKNVRLTAY